MRTVYIYTRSANNDPYMLAVHILKSERGAEEKHESFKSCCSAE